MTKATSKAQRRRKRTITLANGQTARQPATQGARHDLEADPMQTVLTTRCAKAGIPPTDANKSAARDPIYSDPSCRCIAKLAISQTERDRMKEALFDITGAYLAYCRSIGVTPFAKSGKVEYLPERFEARADQSTDLRTPEERAIAAKRRWAAVRAKLHAMGRAQAGDLWDGIMLARDMERDGRPTTAGMAFVNALRVYISG